MAVPLPPFRSWRRKTQSVLPWRPRPSSTAGPAPVPPRGAAGGAGASAIPRARGEGGEHPGRPVPGRVVHHHHLDALEVRARLQDGEPLERGGHEVLLVVDRDEDGQGGHGTPRSSAGRREGEHAARRRSRAPVYDAAVRLALSLLSLRPGQVGGAETYVRALVRHLPAAAAGDELLLLLDRDLDREIAAPGLDQGGAPLRRRRARGPAHRRGLHPVARPDGGAVPRAAAPTSPSSRSSRSSRGGARASPW